MEKKPKQLVDMSSSTTILVATAVILIGFLLLSDYTFKPMLENPVMAFREGPLEKNTELQLKPEEVYTYGYYFNNTQFNITYMILDGGTCTRIRLLERPDTAGVCLDRWGRDRSGYDSAYEDLTILFFKPWMLALEDSWKWNVSMYMSFDGSEHHITDTLYRVMRTETYKGRTAYVVEIKSDDGITEYDWIDAEKRILLKTMGEGYTLELVDGLPLE